MKASWRGLGGVLGGLGGILEVLGGVLDGLGGVLEASLEAMLSQDRSKKAQDAKTLKKPRKTKVLWPPAEASWRHLGGVLEAMLSQDGSKIENKSKKVQKTNKTNGFFDF